MFVQISKQSILRINQNLLNIGSAKIIFYIHVSCVPWGNADLLKISIDIFSRLTCSRILKSLTIGSRTINTKEAVYK